jgi:septal ring factor EnvC (AmiA/AmiB activator)
VRRLACARPLPHRRRTIHHLAATLQAVRQELEDLRGVAFSLSQKLNTEVAEEYERKLRESAARAAARAAERERAHEGANAHSAVDGELCVGMANLRAYLHAPGEGGSSSMV